jgi:ATP-dependent helicase/DNAse subunit B
VPRRLKPRGLLTLRGLAAYEPEAVAGGGRARFFNAVVTKDGALGDRGRSDVVYQFELELLLRHVEGRVRDLLRDLGAGRSSARPVYFRDRSACATCAYESVCRFEASVDRRRFNVLDHLKPQQVILRLERDAVDTKVFPDAAAMEARRRAEFAEARRAAAAAVAAGKETP